jgi:hypothetical protein
MRTAKLDDKRRLVMPPELEPGDAVTIQPLDADHWLVKRLRREKNVKLVAIPVIERLPDDAAWENIERRLAKAASNGLPEPE